MTAFIYHGWIPKRNLAAWSKVYAPLNWVEAAAPAPVRAMNHHYHEACVLVLLPAGTMLVEWELQYARP